MPGWNTTPHTALAGQCSALAAAVQSSLQLEYTRATGKGTCHAYYYPVIVAVLSRHTLAAAQHHIALGGKQDSTQVVAMAAIDGAGRQGLRPHAIVRQAMDADESRRRKLAAQLPQLGQCDQLQIHHHKRRAIVRHRR